MAEPVEWSGVQSMNEVQGFVCVNAALFLYKYTDITYPHHTTLCVYNDGICKSCDTQAYAAYRCTADSIHRHPDA